MTRIPWADAPPMLQTAAERALAEAGHERIDSALSISGGFSPGVVEQLCLADGSLVFFKATSTELNPVTPSLHLGEALLIQHFPREVPHAPWIATIEIERWIGLMTEFVPGGNPQTPLSDPDVNSMIALVDQLAGCGRIDVPGLRDFPDELEGYWFGARKFEEAGVLAGLESTLLGEVLDAESRAWLASNLRAIADCESKLLSVASGDCLLHGDMRADNVLANDARGFVVVDWAWARRGNPLFDLVGMLPSLHLDGAPPPWEAISRSAIGRAASEDNLRVLVAALTGDFMWASVQPAPPGIPHVRHFQARLANVCLRWLQILGGQ